MLILPSVPVVAQQLLRTIAAQRTHCTAIVFENTEETREAASRADVRAENHPFRKVVWIPQPSVLDSEAQFAELTSAHAQGVTTLFLTIRFKPAFRLEGAEARRFLRIERGFITAEVAEP